MSVWDLAKKVTTRLIDATSTWTSTTTQIWTVPGGERWKLILIAGYRNASGTVTVKHLSTAGTVLAQIGAIAAAAGLWTVPSTATSDKNLQMSDGLILDAGEDISLVYGAAQDGTAYHSIIYMKVKV